MPEYNPRLVAPAYGDLHWVQVASGGYNRCIYGSLGPIEVIPNCTGYVHGRWMELGNTTQEYNLSFGNAGSYYNHVDEYARGQEPMLGAIICFAGNHVAIVEEIAEDGSYIVCSESDWGGARFSVRTRYRANNWSIPGYTGGFQGFIYHPDIAFKKRKLVLLGTRKKRGAKHVIKINSTDLL